MKVEVIYALSAQQGLIALDLPDGATVRDAITASGVLALHPEITLGAANKIGIFGKLVTLDTPLRADDRVEIYRPLLADPKDRRRRKVASERAEARQQRFAKP